MKKLLFIVVIITISAQAQNYVHLPDSNAVWTTLNDEYVFIGNDTTHNGKVYKKYIDSKSYMGYSLVREDTVTKKVYYIYAYYSEDINTIQESLLYDFSLQVDDTTTVGRSFGTHHIKVKNIDSILIGNSYRKRWRIVNYYDPYFYEYWIEGIGSTSGVLSSGEGTEIIFDGCQWVLICFEQNGVQLYHHTNYNTCSVSYEVYCGLSIKENPSNQINLSVYPNPASEILNVECEMSNGETEIKIIDLLGREMLNTKMKIGNNEINVSSLPKGIYFIKAGSRTQKFMKE